MKKTYGAYMETNEKKNKYQLVKDFVSSRIFAVTESNDISRQKYILAKLRRSVGRIPAECPETWGFILEKMPAALMGENEISFAETAIFTSLTLYALHQQGKDIAQNPMHVKGCRLGSSVASLIKSEDDTNRVIGRFNRLASASNFDEAAHQVQTLIGMLNSKSIPLDYSDLAGDFYKMQFDDNIDDIRMKWGKDFYRKLPF